MTFASGRMGATLLAFLIIGSPATFVGNQAPASTSTQQQVFQKDCLDGVNSGPLVPSNISVAVIKPVFTSTPYSQYPYGSFYAFYKKYVNANGNITTNLDWLNTSVKSGVAYNSGWGHTFPLYSFLNSQAARGCGLVLGKNLRVISDINVSDGALFNPGGGRRFDAAIIGHQEYVTQSEYDQLRLFVASGGRLIAMSSNQFYGEVSYDHFKGAEIFMRGHGGYFFNGRTAWYDRSRGYPWNASGWFGSVYCCFHRFQYHGGAVNATNPVGSLLNHYYGSTVDATYSTHEENRVSNYSRTSIIATYLASPEVTVASYIHEYGRGAVFSISIFGEDLIQTNPSTQYFLIASLAIPYKSAGPSTTSMSTTSQATTGTGLTNTQATSSASNNLATKSASSTSGGVPEFRYQLLAVAALAIVVVMSYLANRRNRA